MAALYLDHDIPGPLSGLLRLRGHDVVIPREAASQKATDGAHLLAATQQGHVLITHNGKDYILLHDAWNRWFAAYSTAAAAAAHAGILVIPQQEPRRDYWLPEFAVAQIALFLADTSDLAGRAFEWTPAGGWVER